MNAHGFAHRGVLGRQAGCFTSGASRAELVLKSFAMPCAKSKHKVVTIRALKPDDFTAEEFDRIASEHGRVR